LKKIFNVPLEQTITGLTIKKIELCCPGSVARLGKQP